MKQTKITDQFHFAGGSTIGSDHVKLGKPNSTNNQDAFTWRHGRHCSFAVVCDGSSSGAHSEVGAHLIAQILSHIVVQLGDKLLDMVPTAYIGNNEFWGRIERNLINDMTSILRMMGGSESQQITDYFLATIVGVLITPSSTFVVYVGDGAYAVDGVIHHFQPEANNSPTYIAYQLSGTTLQLTNPDALKIKVHKVFDTDRINSIFIGTDGVDDIISNEETNLPGKDEKFGPLDQFWKDDRFFKNPDMIRRRLALMGLERVSDGHFKSSPLTDDTTVVVIRRKKEPQPQPTTT